MKRKKILLIVILLALSSVFIYYYFFKNSELDDQVYAPIVESLDSIEDITGEMFTSRDYQTSYTDYETVNLNNLSSYTITSEGNYYFTGSMSGSINIDVSKDEKVSIILDNVSISSSGAGIYVITADKVFVTTVEGSVNTIKSSSDDSTDACIYSKEDIVLNGNGTLNLNCTGSNGVTSKDDLKVTSGTYNIISDKHGLEANDSIRIAGGTFNIMSGKDGLKSENDEDSSLGYVYILDAVMNIDATTDGIDSGSVIEIYDGSYNIVCGGGYLNYAGVDSYKALKAAGNIIINGGSFDIDALDDAIHSDYSLEINGGTFSIYTGDDALHANYSLTINGGSFDILDCYEAIESQKITINGGTIYIIGHDDALNAATGSFSDKETFISITGGYIEADVDKEGDGFDSNGSIYISGGTFIISSTDYERDTTLDFESVGSITGGTFLGTGANSITIQNFSYAEQGSIVVVLPSIQSGSVTLTDSSGKEIVNFIPAKDYEAVIISTPDILLGETYTLKCGTYSEVIEMDELIYGGASTSGPGGNNSGPSSNGGMFRR